MVRHKTLKRFTPKANSSKAIHSEQSNRRKIHMDSLECKSKFCQCWKDDKDSKLPKAETITAKLQTNKAKKEVVPKFNNATQNVSFFKIYNVKLVLGFIFHLVGR